MANVIFSRPDNPKSETPADRQNEIDGGIISHGDD